MFDKDSWCWPVILLQMLTSFWSLLLSDTFKLPQKHMTEKVRTLNKTQSGLINIKRFEFSKKVQSPLTHFENNVTMFDEFQFRIHYHPKILKMVNRFNSFIVNDGGL